MSEVKVNKISPRSGTTVTLGDSGDTFTIPSGATINNQGTATNFGATGSASWSTTVKTGDFTAVAGEGYFVDTTSQAIDVTLPAGTAGAVVAIKDYAKTFDTNAVTLIRNGSDKIGGASINGTINTEGIAVTLIFIDSTQGWLVTDDGLQSSVATASYITATGGNAVLTSTCGNFKSHVFTGPGTFTVCTVGNACGSDKIDYLVVAGGGSAGGYYAAAGAGGFRMSNLNNIPGPTMSPLSNPTGLPVTATGYPVVVGGGAPAGPPGGGGFGGYNGNNGTPSVFTGSSTITSAGGGFGAASGPTQVGGSGGSGGNSGYYRPGCGQGAGNTPPVSPPQGNPAGRSSYATGGGGGGAGAAGSDGTLGGSWSTSPVPGAKVGGAGGVGSYLADSTLGPTAPSYGEPGPVSNVRYFAGGGGSGICGSGTAGAGGAGGGGDGAPNGGPFGGPVINGIVNTGGGGGGSGGGLGGSGIVIIRYKFQ
jgi:hypothetical protein